MEKRAFLAVFLSILVFILYQYYYLGKIDTVKVKSEESKTVEQAIKLPTENKISDIGEGKRIDGQIITEKEIIINTGATEVILSNKGGKIKAIYLQKYRTKDNKPVSIIEGGADGLLPVTLEFMDKNFSHVVNSTLFELSEPQLILKGDTVTLSSANDNFTVGFLYSDSSGFRISKEYTFYHDDYKIGINIKTSGDALSVGGFMYRVLWGTALKAESNSNGYGHEGTASFIDGKLVLDKLKDKGEQVYHEGDIKWVAMQNKYFMAALIPIIKDNLKSLSRVSDTGDMAVGLEYTSINGKLDNRFIVYAGPKDSDRLITYNASLEEIIDYGWFSFLAKPLFKVLKLFYRFSHNYGVAIIILTIIIKIIFFPLSQKSFKSMQRMQRLQPELKIIQERYKNNRQKMGEELMRLYKENKINPLGGFLPILIQIPVFIALYNVLMYSIELRQSPFIWWIKDLSEKDPYYVTPILMGATMLIQQKMTPSGGDPMQAKVMLIMPVIFTFMFLNFPSGLVIYWLVNNILSIAQQYVINKDSRKPQVANYK